MVMKPTGKQVKLQFNIFIKQVKLGVKKGGGITKLPRGLKKKIKRKARKKKR